MKSLAVLVLVRVMSLLAGIVSGSASVISLLRAIIVGFTALFMASLSSASLLTTISGAPDTKGETLDLRRY